MLLLTMKLYQVKTTLLSESGKAVKRLLDDGCEKVFIVWDLFPAWREDKGKPCRHEDKEVIKASLTSKGLSENDVIFLCLEAELEAWLIADGRVLNSYFSKPHRPVDRIKNEKNPDKVKDPKGKLMGYFKEYKHIQYEGTIHAEQIIKNIQDWQKIRKSQCFSRFFEKLSGNPL